MSVNVQKESGEQHQADDNACSGYPFGVWADGASPFCADPYNDRHKECGLSGCTCPCHASTVIQA